MSGTLLRRLVLLMSVSVLGSAIVISCRGSDRDTPAVDQPDPAGGDQALLLALAQVRNFHHLADVHLEDGHPEAAIDALKQALVVPFPATATEGEDVRLDTRAWLAKLLLGLGRAAEAEQLVREGLAQSTRESFFQANLHVVLAEVLRARGDRHGAIQELDTAIQIEKRLQDQVLREKTP